MTDRFLAGALAGLVATAPMTLAMKAARRRLPPAQRATPLPPRRIAMRAAGKAGFRHKLDEPQRRAVTLLAHYGYGTAVGGLFGPVAPRDPAAAIVGGIGYGLLVWAGSYLGLLPALDLHPPATREAPGRNAMMIAAHVMWGATLGATVNGIRRMR